jgi:uroporphyrinogen-III synthase
MRKNKIVDTAENASGLAKKIIENGVQELVFFCGDRRRDELPTILSGSGIVVEEIIVYRTIETPVTQTGNLDGVMFFSPSGVQSFFSVNQLNKNTVCFAIGETTASIIRDYTDNKIITSEFPRQQSLTATVAFYFQHRKCYE